MPDDTPGPLPKSGRNDELQELSITALRQALPVDRFQLRAEPQPDKGTDWTIELKCNGESTNIRSHLQLKATDSNDLNLDGSFSLSVETSNLNYLLNGPSPLYVVWIASRDELRFVWARDEEKRLFHENPKWRKQQSITLRFSEAVPTAIERIYERIRSEGSLQRQLHDVLARTAMTERAVVAIDPQTLTITDPDEILELLNGSGLALVAAGYSNDILGLVPGLRANQVREPRIQLVCGYAELTNGRYMSAGGHLATAMLSKDKLSVIDQHFLLGLRNACDLHLGRIDYPKFLQGEKELARTAPPELALQYQLEIERSEHLRERDLERRRSLWLKLQATADQILRSRETTPSLKLQARLVRLYANGIEANYDHVHALTTMRMRRGMGLAPGTRGTLDEFTKLQARHAESHQEAEQILREASALQHPLLVAEAIITHAVIFIAGIADRRFFLASMKLSVPDMPAQVNELLQQRLATAIQLSSRAGCVEGEVRAKLVLADWLVISGEEQEAKKTAQSVLGPAIAMGYENHRQSAEDHLRGQSDYQKLMSLLERGFDHDVQMSSASDSDMRRFAIDCIAAMELPTARLPVVERDCLAMRDVARERMQWCQHLEMIQDLSHTFSRDTAYLNDPARQCICEKHNYQSKIMTTDWAASIVAFKAAYCENCPDRQPKHQGSNEASALL